MKYGLGIKILISFIVGGIAILYKQRINPKNNQAESSINIKVPRPFLFNLVSDIQNVPKVFTWISDIYEVDERKNLSMGKQYYGSINMPFWGKCDFHYKISEIKHGQWIIMVPDPLHRSYLNAEVIAMFNSITHTETQFYMKIVYHRPSALFQLTVAPILKYLTDQQLERTNKFVEEMALTKWKQWQATNVTKARKTGSTTTTTTAAEGASTKTASSSTTSKSSTKTNTKSKMPLKNEL